MRTLQILIVLTAVAGLVSAAMLDIGDIDTYAGTGTGGYTGDGGPATSADLNKPLGLAADSAGNLYIADTDNMVVRKVDAATGIITTFAGTGTVLGVGDGRDALGAAFNLPEGVAADASGNIYVADTANHRIRKIDGGTNIVTTIAGTGVAGYSGDGAAATDAMIDSPTDVVLDSTGRIIFSDTVNDRVRMIDLAGDISTVAGNGTAGSGGDGGLATAAEMKDPTGLFITAADEIYVADEGNNAVRKFTVGGTIDSVAGQIGSKGGYSGDGGDALLAEFNKPHGLWVEQNGSGYAIGNAMGFDTVFGNTQNTVKDVQIATQVTLAADRTIVSVAVYMDGTGNDMRCGVYSDAAGEPDVLQVESAKVADPASTGWYAVDLPDTLLTAGTYWLALAFDDDAQAYYYDAAGGQTRETGNDVSKHTMTDPWGTSDASNTRRVSIYAGFLEPATGTVVYVADTSNDVIRKFLEGGTIETIAGDGSGGFAGDGGPATSAKLSGPEGLVMDASANIFIGDAGNARIRKVDDATGNISTYAGTGTAAYGGDGGPATSADLNGPVGLVFDASGDLVLADTGNHVIRKIDVSTGDISLLAGTPGETYSLGDGYAATEAYLDKVEDITFDASDNLYIACTILGRVRRVDGTTGIITTVMGTGTEYEPADPNDDVLLDQPAGLAVDSAGNVYVTDRSKSNCRVVKLNISDTTYSTVAGDGSEGFSGDGWLATAAKIKKAEGISFDTSDNLYIADTGNNRIRKVDAATTFIDTIAGSGGKGGYSGDGGDALLAELNKPHNVHVMSDGTIYFADTGNHVVRTISPAGIIDTFAGTGSKGYSGDGGPATLAQLEQPGHVLVVSSGGRFLYIADTNNERIRYIPLGGGRLVRWAEVQPD